MAPQSSQPPQRSPNSHSRDARNFRKGYQQAIKDLALVLHESDELSAVREWLEDNIDARTQLDIEAALEKRSEPSQSRFATITPPPTPPRDPNDWQF